MSGLLMSGRRVTLSVLTVAAVAAVVVVPRTGREVVASAQDQVRDAARVAMTGTASVSGVVLTDDENHTPVRHATLQLVRGGITDIRLTATDDRGRYLFSDLPAASYTLRAAKPAYVGITYGASRPELPGSPIPLTDGQHFECRPILLMHGAVIAGTITDARGRPAGDVQVQIRGFRLVNGQRQPASPIATGNMTTDSRGAYRVFGLPPGDYLVSSAARMFVTAEFRELTTAEVQWAQHEASGGPATSIAPGTTAPVLPPPSRSVVYAPTFYPGTTDAAVAVVVTVGRAEERTGVDFALQEVSTARVSGRVVTPEGKPASRAVLSRAAAHVSAFAAPDFSGITTTAPDGSFSYVGVAPGSYTILARASEGEPARGVASGPLGLPTGPLGLWGVLDVIVNGDDLTDLTIPLQRGMTVTGRIVIEAHQARPPADLSTLQPSLVPFDDKVVSLSVNNGGSNASADGTFKIEGVTPGAYMLTANAQSLSSSWVVKSATVNGRDVLDHPLDVRPGEDVSGAAITLTDLTSEITGQLRDASGAPAGAYQVLVFPTDRGLWTSRSRWIRSVRAGVDGSYRLERLPPGEYYLAALTEIAPGEQTDPSFLEQVVSQAIKVTLAEGQKLTQSFRVGG